MNDKLYFAVKYDGEVYCKIATLTEHNYSIQAFASKLQTAMNDLIDGNPKPVEVIVSYNVDKLTLSIKIQDNRVVKSDAARWRIFPDDGLKRGAFLPMGRILEPLTCNELLQNYVWNNEDLWTPAMISVDYHVDLHTTRNLYLLVDLGEFRTVTNFPWSGSSVLKKTRMNVPYNETLFFNVVMPYDCTHVGSMSFNRLTIHLVNSKGNYPNLRNNWSFSLIFERQWASRTF